jgi:CheY-like chemotaxis protein/anti-sigma regulatory factor (Ser/Thr protein kinase)
MPTLLVVDDAAVDRRFVGELLADEGGIQVQYAVHGADALLHMARALPDLVVTDLLMPEMDGLELVGLIREKYPAVPVILMTSQGNEETAAQALHDGAASYVPKRLLSQYLLNTIHKVLGVAIRDRSQARLMTSLQRSDSLFYLENDPALFGPLVTYLQEGMSQMGVCGDADRIRVGVALEEALANALYHGNLEIGVELRESDSQAYGQLIQWRRRQSPYRERRIEVEAQLGRDEAIVVIRDGGPGFDLAAVPDPTLANNLERSSGRGIFLMRAFMDEVAYHGTGNAVTLTKRRPGCASPNRRCNNPLRVSS